MSQTAGLFGRRCKVMVEDVSFQLSTIQMLEKMGVDVEGFKVGGQDKRARLDSVTYLIKTGKVLFPREGVEALRKQLVYFGVEKYDDLVDAFTIVLHTTIKKDVMRIQILNKDMLGL